jgi:predicted phage-related endonuclease
MTKIFTESELVQKSDEWIKFRRESGIGASEIPTLMGDVYFKFRTPFDIFLQKLGKVVDNDNEDTKRGNLCEEAGRRYVQNYLNSFENKSEGVLCRNVFTHYEFKTEQPVKFEQFTAVHPKYPILASFDGVDITNGLLLELKSPKEANFKKVLRSKQPSKQYRTQIQGQFMVAKEIWGIENGIFSNYFPDGIYVTDKKKMQTNLYRSNLIKTQYDPELDEKIGRTCEVFWEMVQRGVWDQNWKDKIK